MKVAFVLGTSTGGTARHVQMLASGCAARGLAVEVFGPAQTDRDFGFSSRVAVPADVRAPSGAQLPPDGPVPSGAQLPPDGPVPSGTQLPADTRASAGAGVRFVPVEIADRPRLRRDLRAIARLRRLFGGGEPDVVHAHGLRAGALTAIAVAFVRPRHSRARRPAAPPALIVTLHNAPPAGGMTGAIYRVLELIVARNAASVLCVSPDLEERMRAAGARRVGHAVVPVQGGPEGWVSPVAAGVRGVVPPGQRHRPLVLAVGRLAAQKGFSILLEAAALWRDIQPAPLLVIVGEGPLEAQLKDRAASLGLGVEFAGSRPDVPALLASAQVFVLPSVWEGQPLVLQEALRAGVPVVATRVGGVPDLTGDDAALLVPPGDARRLAEAVRAVLADPALADRLRHASLERARSLPGEDQAVAAALAEYWRVAVSRPAP
jgi:glycosyltransferase involved in cell wall biosynthesis